MMNTVHQVRPTPPVRVSWLRANLALVGFAMSVLGALLGGLISGTVRVVDYENRLRLIEKAHSEQSLAISAADAIRTARETSLNAELRERDTRIEALSFKIIDTRHDLEAQLSAISQRAALLEMQTRFIGDTVHQVQSTTVTQHRTSR